MPKISPLTTMGPVHLTIADLERAVSFYEQEVGLQLIDHSSAQASLGAGGRALIVLVEEPDARRGGRFSGLYHTALVLPERRDLARWLRHAAENRVSLDGMSDHFVSEALYLTDPDGHGLEIYADRPRPHWEGQVSRMSALRLDTDGLLATIADDSSRFDRLPAGTSVGHVHLKVSSLAKTIAFYRDLLGFDLMLGFGSQAAFLGAGGYHHHIGANVWNSEGAPPPPPGTVALRQSTVVLPDDAERDATLARLRAAGQRIEACEAGSGVRDPSGNVLVLATAHGGDANEPSAA